MEFPERDVALAWVGRTLVDRDGSEIGACTAVFTDDATQVTEWVCAQVDGSAIFIPAVGATEAGEQVRVSVSRDDVADAPAVGGAEHITNEEEAALYRHYGIPHSRDASPTLLPTGEPQPDGAESSSDGTTDGVTAPAGPESQPGAEDGDGPSGGGRRMLPAAAGLAGVGLAVGTVLGARRLRRRRPPTRKERILARAGAASSAVTAGTGRIAAAAAPLLATAGRLVRGRVGVVAVPAAAAVALPVLRRRRSRTDSRAYLNGDGRELSLQPPLS